MGVVGVDGVERILTEELGDVHNILLLVPPMRRADVEACMDLLTVADPRNEQVLCVSFTRTPDERFEEWQTHVGVAPAAFTVIAVGDRARSSAAGSSSSGFHVDTVSNPADLTGLGVRITQSLQGGNGGRDVTVLCFHSLTTLLQYAELKRVYRFLHVLTGHVKERDAVAHYHMSPEAHEPRSVNTLKTLFDTVVEFDGEGGWTTEGGR